MSCISTENSMTVYLPTQNIGRDLFASLFDCQHPIRPSLVWFGLVQFDANSFPAKVAVISPDEVIDSTSLDGVDIVLAAGDSFDRFHLAGLCKRRGIKCIDVIECTWEPDFK